MTAPTPRNTKRYGWVPDLPDQRDLVFAAPPAVLTALPTSVDLRSQCPQEVYDQGALGSCTANAVAGAFEYELLKQGLADFMPARLFIYYNERAKLGTVDTDSGAMIRDGVKSVNKQGVCDELKLPYDIAKFTEKPADELYQDALNNRATSYQRVIQTLAQLKGTLAAGHPVIFGFTVYESFESQEVARTGEVPMPATGEQVLGGHAVLAVGYDDATGRFLVRNSWGAGWGQGGYFTMPYAYLTERSLSSDFWALITVS